MKATCLLATGEHIALVNVLTGFAGAIPTVELMTKQQTLKGLIIGSRAHQQAMVCARNQWGWRPVLDRTFALADIDQAFAHQQSGQHFGKIVLAVQPD